MQAAPESLPHVDEHSLAIEASPEATWDALLRVVEGTFDSPRARRAARFLGCADVAPSGPRPLAAGSSVPGFRAASAQPADELALAGRHRYSRYALTFRVRPSSSGTRLSAETRAEFPGVAGRLYRALVIGTRGHVVVTKGLLAAVKRRAERTATAPTSARGAHGAVP